MPGSMLSPKLLQEQRPEKAGLGYQALVLQLETQGDRQNLVVTEQEMQGLLTLTQPAHIYTPAL